jgi:hypothetical protein
MSDEIRPFRAFSQDSLQAAVDKALGEVPSDKTLAVVAYADLSGARLAALVRLGGGWSFVGTLEKPYSGTLNAAAELRWSI